MTSKLLVAIGTASLLCAVAVLCWPYRSADPTKEQSPVITLSESVSAEPMATSSPPPATNVVGARKPASGPSSSALTSDEVTHSQVAAAPPALSKEDAAALSQELLQEIHKGARRVVLTERAQELLRELKGHDGEVVPILIDDFSAPERPFAAAATRNVVIVKALAFMASEDAKGALLTLASAPDEKGYAESNAAEVYASLTKSPEELAKLLSSTAEGPRIIGAQKLAGAPLDAQITESLGQQLVSNSPRMHVAVAEAFSKDPANETAQRKVELLLENAGKIGALEKSDKVEYLGPWTFGERVFLAHVDALSRMPGGEAPLRDRPANATSAAREMIVIALANRNATEVHDELVRIIRETQVGIVRTAAVKALSKTATKDDVPLLRPLAESDPFYRPGDIRHEGPNAPYEIHEYPVREAASGILWRLEKASLGK